MHNEPHHFSDTRSLSGRIRFPLRQLAFRLVLAAGCLGMGTSIAQAQSNEANIGVRTKVVDGWVRPKGKEPADGGHSKVFGLLAVEEIKADQRLVKPVDVQYLKGVLLKVLAENGFRPYAKGQNPDILLTMSYGRGELANPYVRDQGEIMGLGAPIKSNIMSGTNGGGGGQNTEPVTTVSVTGTAEQLFDEKGNGYQQKIAKSRYEKLFIRVTAFEFPKTPSAKPKMLWKTTIVTDDPDHREFNSIAAEMLAARAPLFDKETAEKEVDLYKPLPNGRVNVGTPEVVEPPDKPKT